MSRLGSHAVKLAMTPRNFGRSDIFLLEIRAQPCDSVVMVSEPKQTRTRAAPDSLPLTTASASLLPGQAAQAPVSLSQDDSNVHSRPSLGETRGICNKLPRGAVAGVPVRTTFPGRQQWDVATGGISPSCKTVHPRRRTVRSSSGGRRRVSARPSNSTPRCWPGRTRNETRILVQERSQQRYSHELDNERINVAVHVVECRSSVKRTQTVPRGWALRTSQAVRDARQQRPHAP